VIRRNVGMRVRLLSLALVLAAFALPLPARAADAPVRLPRWTRPLAPEASYRTVAVLLPLADGSVLVRNGTDVFATDARGVTRWSMPNVTAAVTDGSAVVFGRSNVVFAVRSRDAGVLWKRPCAEPPYLVAVADRVVTVCGGISTVFRARDGSVLARHTVAISTSPASIQAARRLTDRYLLVTNFFDGAWMGEAYYVVDARTGAFLWSLTDSDFFDTTTTTVDVSQYPSMLPSQAVGTVQRRHLADGVVVSTEHYDTPNGSNLEVRGLVTTSRAATYVLNMETGLFRFRRGETRDPQSLVNGARASPLTLGSAAFIFPDQAQSGLLYLDRPSARGIFSTRLIGQYSGSVTAYAADASHTDSNHAVRLGDRLAVADGGVIRLYDEFGRVEMSAKSPCALPEVATTRTMLFMRCAQLRSPGILAGFERP
jgi:outer membrane protein assembly factor BamB